MPEYKRKKTHSRRRKRVTPEAGKPRASIRMRPKKEEKADTGQDSAIRVVRGKKGERRRKLLILSAVAAAVVLTLVILSAVLPVGLYESTRDFTLSFGSGSFPAAISGNGIINCVPKNRYYYTLTDTSISAFTNGGKKVFSFVHGFSSPVLVTSQTRALLFDQGKNSVIIYNLSGVVKTLELKEPIIAADIAQDGEYALVT